MIYTFADFNRFMNLFDVESLDLSIRIYPLRALDLIITKDHESVYFTGTQGDFDYLKDVLPERTKKWRERRVGKTGIFLIIQKDEKRIYRVYTRFAVEHTKDRILEILEARKKITRNKD